MRLRILLLACVAMLAGGTAASGQEWARKMFRETSHDFGAGARGATVEYRFKFKNVYKETLHVSSVHSSCGCAKPTITKKAVKSLETSEIVAVFNTVSFLGKRNATLTVHFDEPFPARVQLRITGFIRSDVVLTPGKINFGRVRAGTPSEQWVDIAYAGRNSWEIVDVRTANRHLEAELVEKKRGNGQVSYRMLIRLLADAPTGYLHDRLTIVTNDAKRSRIPLEVEGKIESEVTVSPLPLVFGVLKPGETATRKIVVRGTRPFRIVGVKCDDCFKVKTTDAVRKYHLVPVTFMANGSGKIAAKIHIETDLGKGAVPDVPAYAEVDDGPER